MNLTALQEFIIITIQKSCESFSEFYDGCLKILRSFNLKLFTTTANIYYIKRALVIIRYGKNCSIQ